MSPNKQLEAETIKKENVKREEDSSDESQNGKKVAQLLDV